MASTVNEYAQLKAQLASAKSLIRSMGDGTPMRNWGLRAIAAGMEAYINAIGENKVINERELTTQEIIEGQSYYYDLAKKKMVDESVARVKARAKKGLELKRQHEREQNNNS